MGVYGRSYVIQGQLRDYVRHSRLVTYIDIFLYLTYIKDTCVIYMKCVNLFLHIYTSSYIDSLFLKVPNVECKLLFMQNSKIILASHDKNLIQSNMIICHFVPFVGYIYNYIRTILYLI